MEKALCQPQKRRQGEKKLEWVAQGGLEVSARPAFVTDYSRDTTCFMELHTCRFKWILSLCFRIGLQLFKLSPIISSEIDKTTRSLRIS